MRGGGNITRFLFFRGKNAILRPFLFEQMDAILRINRTTLTNILLFKFFFYSLMFPNSLWTPNVFTIDMEY